MTETRKPKRESKPKNVIHLNGTLSEQSLAQPRSNVRERQAHDHHGLQWGMESLKLILDIN